MVFKTRKIPKHLIIHDEYDARNKPRFGIMKKLTLAVVILGFTLVVSMGVVQI